MSGTAPTTSDQYIRLARDSGFNYGGQLATALIGFAVVPLLFHGLGAALYGVLILALTCSSLAMFFDLGLGSTVTLEVAAPASPARERFVRSAGPCFIAIGAVGAIALTAVAAVASAFDLTGVGTHAVAVFALIGLAFFGDQITLFHTAVLGGLRRFDVLNLLLVGTAAVRGLGIAVLMAADAGVEAVAAWYAVAAWVGAVANVVVLRTASPPQALRLVTPDLAALRSRLPFSAGSTVIMLSLGAFWNFGPLVVAAASGAGATARFQISQRFPLAVQALPERISHTIFPAASQYEGADGKPLADLIVTGTRLIAAPLIPAMIVLMAVAGDLLDSWLGTVPAGGPTILRLTMLAVAAQGLTAGAAAVLWGSGRVRSLALAVAPASAVRRSSPGVSSPPFSGRSAPLPHFSRRGLDGCRRVDRGRPRCPPVAGGADRAGSWRSHPRRDSMCRRGVGSRPAGLSGAMVQVAAVASASVAAYLVVLARTPGRGLEREAARLFGRWLVALPGRAVHWMSPRVRRFRWLRSARYFLGNVAALRAGPERARAEALAEYSGAEDPWNYRSPAGQELLESAEALMARAANGRAVRRGGDLGCGEGWMTERLIRVLRRGRRGRHLADRDRARARALRRQRERSLRRLGHAP